MTLHRGHGGIVNSGKLKIEDCILSANSYALSAGGQVEIEDSTVTGSTSLGTFNGAILAGNVTIRDSQIVANAGPGIRATYGGLIRVIDSVIQGNTYGIIGTTGFPDSSLFIEITRSTIDSHTSTGILFGTFYEKAAARAYVTDSTISNNGESGIVTAYTDQTDLVVRRSTLSGNSTPQNGGAIFVEGASVAPGGLTQVTIDSSTISGNSAALSGGGIFVANGLRLGRRVKVIRSTVTNNTADSDANGSGNGGGIVTPTPVVDLEDSILAGNTDTGGEAPDCEGPLVSNGHNLLGTAAGCAAALEASDATAAPLLGALAANGGPTATHLPLPGSPAIDAAAPARCGAPDQRGRERPVDGDANTVAACDIGATETGSATDVTFLSDHFLCYDAKPTVGTPALPTAPGLTLTDDLESKDFDAKKTRALCTPADADAQGLADDETHLHAREVKESAGEPRHVRQLGLRLTTRLGMFAVDTIKPDRLLVPASKGVASALPPPDPMLHDVDRYKCYRVRRSSGAPSLPRGASALTVMLENQFTSATTFSLTKVSRVCTSVDEDGLGHKNPAAHLVCLQARTKLPLRDGSKEPTFSSLFSTSEFGTEELSTKRAYQLCVPALLLP